MTSDAIQATASLFNAHVVVGFVSGRPTARVHTGSHPEGGAWEFGGLHFGIRRVGPVQEPQRGRQAGRNAPAAWHGGECPLVGFIGIMYCLLKWVIQACG